MSVKERLIEYIKFKEMSNSAFCKTVGVSNAFISSMVKSIQPDKVQRIALSYPDLNTGWLLTGEGQMLKDGEGSDGSTSGVPYFDVDFINGFDVLTNDQTVNPSQYINFPQYSKADCWVNATGRSMEPLINHGDMVALRRIEDWRTYVLYGEVYAVVTDEYRTIKYVRKSPNGANYVRLVPLNINEYDEQDIELSTIRFVYQVLGCAKKIF